MQRSTRKSQFHSAAVKGNDDNSPLSQSMVHYRNEESPQGEKNDFGNLSVRKTPSEKSINILSGLAGKRSAFATKARALSIDTDRSIRSEGGHHNEEPAMDLPDEEVKEEKTTPGYLKEFKYKKTFPFLSGINTPNSKTGPLNSSIATERSEMTESSENEAEVPEKMRTPEQKILLKKMKKAFWVLYFLGIMFSLKNRVKVMGALRKLEIANEFEKQRTMILAAARPTSKLFPLLPTHRFTMTWTVILCVLVIGTALYTPFRVAFIEEDTDVTSAIDMVFAIGFGIDMVLNFITAFYDSKNGLITSYKLIAFEYLKWWFWIDFVAIFPLDTILTDIALDEAGKSKSANKYNQLLRLLRIPRLYRLLKILRLFKMMRLFSNNQALSRLIKKLNLNIALVKMVKVVLNILFLNHLIGCLWFFVARMDDFAPNTWVARLNIRDESALTQYIASYYWSMQTLTTVGYGDIPPVTDPERIINVLWMMTGVFFYSFTIGNLSNIIGNIDKTSEYIKTRLSAFNAFSLKVKLPEFMRQKVQRFFEINHKENIYYWIDSNHLLDQLPANLRTSLLLFSYYAMIKNISILQYDANFTAAIIVHFKLIKLKKKELVYREDDPPEEIFFISRGSVRMVNEFGDGIYSLAEGTYFGEIEILLDKKRMCFCEAVDSTILLICDKNAFLEVLKDFPAMQKQLERSATTRKDKIKSIMEKMKNEQSPVEVDRRPKLLRSNEYLADIIIGEINSRDKRKKKSFKKQPTIAQVNPKPLIGIIPASNNNSGLNSSMDVKSEAGGQKNGNLMDMIKNLKKQREIVNSANVSFTNSVAASKDNSPKDSQSQSVKNSDKENSFTSYKSRNPDSEAQSNRPQGQGDSEQDNPKVTHVNINKLSDDPIKIENDYPAKEPAKPKKEEAKDKPKQELSQSDKKPSGIVSQLSGFANSKRPNTATNASSNSKKELVNFLREQRTTSVSPLLLPSTTDNSAVHNEKLHVLTDNIALPIDFNKTPESINSQTTTNSLKEATNAPLTKGGFASKLKLAAGVKKNNFIPEPEKRPESPN